ncbi:NAD(P)H-dependent oxidoreductase [Clostridium sardiniense]|uniref:NAD(P)H-dependent oxidoreductase n=1 Tax=Clostridium sardiniense TaxID=29369 RepID=UPI003D34F61B
MKVLIIVDKENKDKSLRYEIISFLKKELTNLEDLKLIDLNEYDLKSCIGCFGCWVKTPGLCVIKDKSEEINREFINSDFVIYVGRITYGSYSVTLKRSLDRLIPNISPFFKIINNEVHHKPRYKRYPKLIHVGYCTNITEEERYTFKSLVKANAVNLQKDKSDIFIVENIEDIKDYLKDVTGIIKGDIK